jgi:hypothetical protein
MELNITRFFREAAPRDYSASIAEIGADAGRATWQAANDDSEDYPILDTDEKRHAFRRFVQESGGWSASEIAAWSDQELNALCIQWIAGDMREVPGIELGPGMTDADWSAYEAMQSDGTVASRIYRGTDGGVYFSIEG